MASDINRTVLTGNLTKDPELNTSGDTAVCKMRMAFNTRRKNSDGEWVDKVNYANVTVFGGLGKSCAEHLACGRPVAVDGRLEWSEWEVDGGGKRQGLEVVAETVKFLGSPDSKDESAD